MTEKIISKKDVEKVAELARMNISEKEKEKFAGNLNEVLDYFKDLSDVEVANFEKFDHYDQEENQFRKDEMDQKSEDEKERIRKLFPEKKGNQLKVKAVLNGSH